MFVYNRYMDTLKNVLLANDPVAVLTQMDAAGTLVCLEPTLAELRMEYLPGAHHKDNLDHSIKVLQQAIDRETAPDLILRTAAIFHDVGKPATRKLDKRNTVTFDGHETVGARMIPKILKKHGYSKSEIAQVAELVALHMRSHGFEDNGSWTDSGVRRLINDLSNEQQMDRLITIFYADVTTKHEHKRNRIHAQVDNLVAAIKDVKEKDARKSLRPSIDGHEVMKMFNLAPGRELGQIMKFLNTDEGIALSREEAIAKISEILA